MTKQVCVFQDWLFSLSMQQQSVLSLACRGPDGIGKFHPTKAVVARYRATVLKSAYYGRPIPVDTGETSFMNLLQFSDDAHWETVTRAFLENVDALPHHYYMHLMHGAEIAGYKHPDELFRKRWSGFYLDCCEDLHLFPESEQDMDRRLCDWDQKHWEKESAA